MKRLVAIAALLVAVVTPPAHAAPYDVDYRTAIECAASLTTFASVAEIGKRQEFAASLSARGERFLTTAMFKGRLLGKSDATVRNEYTVAHRRHLALTISELKRKSDSALWSRVRPCLDRSGGPGGR